MTEERRLSREELYEKVWSEPVGTIAKRLGISDVALAKDCKRLKIPLPGRGYWAKKAVSRCRAGLIRCWRGLSWSDDPTCHGEAISLRAMETAGFK